MAKAIDVSSWIQKWWIMIIGHADHFALEQNLSKYSAAKTYVIVSYSAPGTNQTNQA